MRLRTAIRSPFLFAALAPALLAASPSARLTAVQGRLELVSPTPRTMSAGESLARASTIQTRDGGTAELLLDDGTRVLVRPGTTTLVRGERNAAGRVTPSRLSTLLRGGVRLVVPAVPSGTQRFETFATPTTEVRVMHDSEAAIYVDAHGQTRVSVYRGRAYASMASRMRPIEAGTGVRITRGDILAQPAPLPAAPAFTRLPTPLSLATDATTVSLSAAFAAVDATPVAQWHTQWARDAAFDELVSDQLVAGDATSTEAHALTPGAYFVRVSAVASDGVEGPFGAPVTALVGAVHVHPATRSEPALLEPIP